MADKRDTEKQAQAAAQADLELSEKDAEAVKGGRAPGKKSKKGPAVHTPGSVPIRGEAARAE